MLTWLFNVLVGQFCWHKWDDIEKGKLIEEGSKIPCGYYINQRCRKCTNWRRINLG